MKCGTSHVFNTEVTVHMFMYKSSFKTSNSHFGTGSDVRIKIRTPFVSIKKQLYGGSKQGDTASAFHRVEIPVRNAKQ